MTECGDDWLSMCLYSTTLVNSTSKLGWLTTELGWKYVVFHTTLRSKSSPRYSSLGLVCYTVL